MTDSGDTDVFFLLTRRPQWMSHGACVGHPEIMYPDRGDGTGAAKRLCNGDKTIGSGPCPVRGQCLIFAIEHTEKWGVWGGKNERERRLIGRERRKHAQAASSNGQSPAGIGQGLYDLGRRYQNLRDRSPEQRRPA